MRFSSFFLDLSVERSTANSKNWRAGATSWSDCVHFLFFKSEWPIGTSECLLSFMQAFSLVWEQKMSYFLNYVMSQKQKRCVPSFLCGQVWESCPREKRRGNAELNFCWFPFSFDGNKVVSSLLKASQLLPLCSSLAERYLCQAGACYSTRPSLTETFT